MQVALVALVVAVALHHHGVGASPNATVANGSVNGKLSERHSYNASASDDLITPDEINAGLLEYVAGPLPLAAMEAAKPKRANARPAAIYMNEFAVYIPRGADVADSIAHKYGFSNMGQVRLGHRFANILFRTRGVKCQAKCQLKMTGRARSHARQKMIMRQ